MSSVDRIPFAQDPVAHIVRAGERGVRALQLDKVTVLVVSVSIVRHGCSVIFDDLNSIDRIV